MLFLPALSVITLYSLSDDFQETLSMIVTYIAISLRLIARLIGLDDITSRSY